VRGRIWIAVLSLSASLSLALALGAACTSVSTVRLQPETVHVGPGLRPIAGIQANATALYVLFLPVGEASLDRVVNRMLVVTAKTMGADKVTDVDFDMTPDSGIWALRKLLGWRSAQASGIAVQVTAMPADDRADEGPEPAPPPAAEPSESPGAP
jgi:hypothetical protein